MYNWKGDLPLGSTGMSLRAQWLLQDLGFFTARDVLKMQDCDCRYLEVLDAKRADEIIAWRQSTYQALEWIEASCCGTTADFVSHLRDFFNHWEYNSQTVSEPLLLGAIRQASSQNRNLIRQRIEQYVAAEDKYRFLPSAEEAQKIVAAVVHRARWWDPKRERTLWDYICIGFGVRQTPEAISFLVGCLGKVLADQEDYSADLSEEDADAVLLMHAMGPRSAWYSFLDLLLDFYVTNLDGIVQEDTAALRSLLTRAADQLKANPPERGHVLFIGGREYGIGPGLSLLLRRHMEDAVEMSMDLLRSIHCLCARKSDARERSEYAAELCADWYEENNTRVRGALREMRAARKKRIRRVRPGASGAAAAGLRVFYSIDDAGRLCLASADSRLPRTDWTTLSLRIGYEGSADLAESSLSWYGDNDSRTMHGFCVPLPSPPEGAASIRPVVEIRADGDPLYSFRDSLYRNVIFIRNGRERRTSSIRPGDYTVFCPPGTRLETIAAGVTPCTPPGGNGFSSWFLELQDNSLVCAGGENIYVGSNRGSELDISIPEESKVLPRLTQDGRECRIALHGSSCTIVAAPVAQAGFDIYINGQRTAWEGLLRGGEGNVADIVFPKTADSISVEICSRKTGARKWCETFVLVDSPATCRFNRKYYFEPSDYQGAYFEVQLGQDFRERVRVDPDEEEIRVQHPKGVLHIPVPRVALEEYNGQWLLGEDDDWYAPEIPENSAVDVLAPAGVSAAIYIGTSRISGNGTGPVEIGRAVAAMEQAGKGNPSTVELRISDGNNERALQLATLYWNPCFLSPPRLRTAGSMLCWDGPEKYIGPAGQRLQIQLVLAGANDETQGYTLSISSDQSEVNLPEGIPHGEYTFTVGIREGGLFRPRVKRISQGTCVIGNEDEIRFDGCTLTLDSVSYVGRQRQEGGFVEVRSRYEVFGPCYVDHLQFVGREDTNDGVLPAYTGILWYRGKDHVRHEFSHVELPAADGMPATVRVNPVRVFYLADGTLGIEDADGDGLYMNCWFDADASEKDGLAKLIDTKPPDRNEHFKPADLYTYRKERGTNA